ncbi:band-7 C-terminal domain-containing protein [Chlorobaculum limnaeum]
MTAQYINEFSNLARESLTIFFPSSISDVCVMVGTLTGLIKKRRNALF